MHQPLDLSGDALLSRFRRTGTSSSQPSAASIPGAAAAGFGVVDGHQRPSSPTSPRALQRSFQGMAGSFSAAASPVLAKPALDTYEVVQLLEKELAAERFERREEVSFITKMHEREVEVWKARAQGATQRLEEERKIFERETSSLDSKLSVAIERARWHEERARRLEEEMARREGAVEAARAAGRHMEAAAQAKDAEHEAERRLAHDEREKLATTLKRVEHDAQMAAQDLRHKEQSAQRDSSTLDQKLRSMENTLLSMKQQESQTLAQMHAQEALLAQAQERADGQAAAQVSELRILHGKHEDACRTIENLETQVEAAKRLASDAANAEQRALEAHSAKHAAELRVRVSEHEVELRTILEQARYEAASEQKALQAKHDLLEKELAEAKMAAGHSRLESERTALDLEQRLREVQHLQLALRQQEEWRDGRVEADVQRELEHGLILQKESEAVTAHRLEANFLERALYEERNRAVKEEQESELREAQHATLIEDLRQNSVKVDLDLLRCQASLTTCEQEQSRSHAALELAQAELLSSRVQVQAEDRERADHVQKAEAHHAEREQVLIAEVAQQRTEAETGRRRLKEELEESEEKRLTVAHNIEQLQGEWEQLKGQNQQLQRTCQLQEHKISMLESTLRSHLQRMDNEVADLCSLKQVLASAELLTGPESPSSEVAFAM